jgi:hypothetical protein
MYPSDMQRELASLSLSVSVMCLCFPPYPRFVSPLNAAVVRVVSSFFPKERYLRGTREREDGDTRVSEDARGRIAACACHTTRGYVPPAECRENLRPCLCVCVSVMCLSPLPPYSRFVSPLNNVAGRAVSSLLGNIRNLRGTRERGRGGTRVSEDALGSIAACACHTTRGHVTPSGMQRELVRVLACVCV